MDSVTDKVQCISKKQHYLLHLATFVPCGCLANSIISLDKAGQDKIFIPLMSSPWQAPQAPTRWCKARCKPQSKYTPWPVLCFGHCIMSRLLHHILATVSRLTSHIPPRFLHRAPCLTLCITCCTSFPTLHVMPHFPHHASCLISHIAHHASLPTLHLTCHASLPALCLASCIVPHLLHCASPPCVVPYLLVSHLASLCCYSPIMQFINSSCI